MVLGDAPRTTKDAAARVMEAIERVLSEGPRTPDMGGSARTSDVGRAIASIVER